MTIIYLLLPITLLIAGFFVAAFIWAAKKDQFEDTLTPSYRILENDSIEPSNERNENEFGT